MGNTILFRGRHNIILEGGMFQFPSEYIDILKNRWVHFLLIDYAPCLVLYPQEVSGTASLREIIESVEEQYEIVDYTYLGMQTVGVNGTLYLPEIIRKMCCLEKGKIILAGMGSDFEIWDLDRFNEEVEKCLDEFRERNQ